jgi:FKBP-type peptidyl-prolyl cis-trans isomerase (trigger factor)
MFQQQGLDIDDLQIDMDDLKADMEGEVKKSIQSEFILLAIAEKEGLEVEEEDLNAFFEHQAQHNPQISAEQLRQYAQQDQQQMQSVQYQALMEKTKSLLMEEADRNEISWSEFEEKQAQNAPAPAGLDEDSSDAGLDEDSSDAGLDEDSSDVGLDEDSSDVEED